MLDCSFDEPLIVKSMSATFNSSGNFVRENGGTLLGSNGINKLKHKQPVWQQLNGEGKTK